NRDIGGSSFCTGSVKFFLTMRAAACTSVPELSGRRAESGGRKRKQSIRCDARNFGKAGERRKAAAAVSSGSLFYSWYQRRVFCAGSGGFCSRQFLPGTADAFCADRRYPHYSVRPVSDRRVRQF